MFSATFFRNTRPSFTLLRHKITQPRFTSFSNLRYSALNFGSSSNRNKVTAVNSQQPVISPSDVFLQGSAAGYIEELYEAWLKDPTSVHLSWQVYFKNIQAGVNPRYAYQPPPTLVPNGMSISVSPGTYGINDHMKVQLLVRAYQVRGHHLAKLDPLGILNADSEFPKELDPIHYGFTEGDLNRQFSLGPGILPQFAKTGEKKTLKEIVEYCGPIGIEYIHIPYRVQCDWIRTRVEIPVPYSYTTEEKRMILDRLIWSDSFEKFIALKYPTEKRFGLEGCEILIPGMKALIDRSVDLGIESIVLGMPHRGRLNVLSNVVRKPNESIFCEFGGSANSADEGSGDVKYHLGMNYDRPTPSGRRVHLSLAANPSHLEAVNPVVLGKVRALQHYTGDEKERHRSMAVLLHGDAAFAAQGIVYETIGFHDLPYYTTGGTIHIVVNNQIGFTTDPRFARSTPYCTDIAKVVNAPIFHVNGDDAEAVTFVCQLASEWRQTFKKDNV
ncbi:10489_t:CDS:2 [Scutellospora calospora]|uniref:10489_t:CDS:1 n=1 Tax=Scutellospora calospora TaxID=85575 RepID=A0ACA9KP34_9GLOM|nr:10489_t:CDS:2 [Scutellospora calospora]